MSTGIVDVGMLFRGDDQFRLLYQSGTAAAFSGVVNRYTNCTTEEWFKSMKCSLLASK